MEKTFKAYKNSVKGIPSISFKNITEYREFLKEIPDSSELVITISDKRSLDQNALFHKIISLVASEIGEDFSTCKIWLTCKFFGCVEKEIDNTVLTVPVQTSKMNKKDFADSLTSLIIFATEELGIVLQDQSNILTKLKQ